jgi:hypothetical protein
MVSSIAGLALGLVTLVLSLPENRFATVEVLYPLGAALPTSLTPDPGREQLNVALPSPHGTRHVAVTVRVAAHDIGTSPGSRDARLYVVPVDRSGRLDWEAAQRIARLSGTSAAQSFRQTIYLEARFAALRFVARINAGRGALDILALREDVMDETPLFRTARPLLIALWIATGLAALAVVLRAATRRPEMIAAIIVAIMFYGGTLMPKELIRLGSGLLKDAVTTVEAAVLPPSPTVGAPAAPTIPRERGWLIEPEKVAHISLCVLLAFFARRALSTRPLTPIFVGLVGIVAATEILQMLTPDRDPSLHDVAIDAAGLIIGLLAADRLGPRGPPCRPLQKS